MKHFSSNGWFSLYYEIPFGRLRGPPKSGILVAILGRMWPKITQYGLAHASRSFLLLSYKPKQGVAALQKQWMILLATYHTICQTESRPQIRGFTLSLAIKSDGHGTVWHISKTYEGIRCLENIDLLR